MRPLFFVCGGIVASLMDRTGIQNLLLSQKLPQRQHAGRHALESFLLTGTEEENPVELPATDEEPSLAKRALDRRALERIAVRPLERSRMKGWFQTEPGSAAPTEAATPNTRSNGARALARGSARETAPGALALPAFLHSLLSAVDSLASELITHPHFLLQVNASRREAIARHLETLALIPSGPTASAGAADAAGGLRRWLDGPRTAAQTDALRIYCEELAVFTAAQALLLKAWSDRGIRALKEEEMGSLNWALASALKPHVPLDREGWSITRNLYSWFVPSAHHQRELWRVLSDARLTDEGPDLLLQLVRHGRRTSSPTETRGYDDRFLSAAWSLADRLGLNEEASSGPIKRKRSAFSPTLRDGAMVRSGPVSWSWMGLESNPFSLATAELAQLWWGPSPPPLWANGSGLEAHSRDQLSLLTLGAMKPSIFSRLSEVESNDLALVLEERTIRAQGRAAESQRLREQLDSLPYFKRLRGTNACLGVLQACVAITRVRPGGYVLWAREEPLGAGESSESLHFLLERAVLRAEWRFVDVAHSLPGDAKVLPKYLYLFQREPEMRLRFAHRPRRITVQGSIRSHVEVPLLVDDALSAITIGAPGEEPLPSRGSWQVHAQVSPIEQKDWMDRWPELSDLGTISQLEKLKTDSLALAGFTTIRPTPPGDSKRGGQWTIPAHTPAVGFWLQASGEAGKRRLVSAPLPRAGASDEWATGSGVQVLVRDASWVAPLCAFLESRVVAEWLDLHCERKGDLWAISEAVVRLIPVPMTLLRLLGAAECGSEFASPLPGEWERLAAEISHDPKRALDALPRLASLSGAGRVRATFFVRAARLLEQTRVEQARLFSLVRPDGSIHWRQLLSILPPSERTGLQGNPLVRLTGALPGSLVVTKITNVKSPMPGLLFATESGLHLHLSAQNPRVLSIVEDQLEGAVNVTWDEIARHVWLPRSLELAETAAHDILRAHGEQSERLRGLRELLVACSDF